MVNVDLSTVIRGGHAVIGVRGELDLTDAGGALLLAAPQQLVIRILALSGLADAFSVHASVEQTELASARHRPA